MTALIPQSSSAVLPSAQDWQTLRSMAQVAIESGMLPAHVKSEQAAIFIALKGRELSIPVTYAWSNISVISGKPVCSAELMLALIYRDHGGQAIQFEETTDDTCRVTYQRRDAGARRAFAFTAAQARTAGLTGGNWQKYPAAMLRARCVSAVARMAFADSIAGMYLAEELGAQVTVTSDGEVVLAPPPPADPIDTERAIVTVAPPATDAQRDWYLKTMSVLGFNGEDRLDIAIDIGGDQFDRLPASVLREIVQAARATLLTHGPDAETGQIAWRIQQPAVAIAS